MVVVIGCPRSGTGFISQLLKEHGLDVGHEVWGKDGISDWRMTWQKPKYEPPPPPPEKKVVVRPKPVPMPKKEPRSPFRTDYPPDPPEPPPPPPAPPEPPPPPPPPPPVYTYTIVHQVRHPLAVIASLSTIALVSWEQIACHTRLTVDDPPLTRAMLGWLYMNQLAQRRAEFTYRVENLREDFAEICRRAGFVVELKPTWSTPENTNGRTHPPVTWTQLEAEDAALAAQVKEAALGYGYAL